MKRLIAPGAEHLLLPSFMWVFLGLLCIYFPQHGLLMLSTVCLEFQQSKGQRQITFLSWYWSTQTGPWEHTWIAITFYLVGGSFEKHVGVLTNCFLWINWMQLNTGNSSKLKGMIPSKLHFICYLALYWCRLWHYLISNGSGVLQMKRIHQVDVYGSHEF